MSMVKEIEAVGQQRGIVKFSSGQDNWHNEEFISKRAELIEKAKNGCIGSKYTLMNEPYNIKALVLKGKTII